MTLWQELVAVCADEAKLSRPKARRALKTAFETVLFIVEREGKLAIPKFGVFSLRSRKARSVQVFGDVNARMELPAQTFIHFRRHRKQDTLPK